MLLCTLFLPKYLGGGALLAGMACDSCITALLSLLLICKKTGRLRMGQYCLRLAAAVLPSVGLGAVAHLLFVRTLGYFPAFALTMIVTAAGELLFFGLLRLVDVRALFVRFTRIFKKKGKKIS